MTSANSVCFVCEMQKKVKNQSSQKILKKIHEAPEPRKTAGARKSAQFEVHSSLTRPRRGPPLAARGYGEPTSGTDSDSSLGYIYPLT